MNNETVTYTLILPTDDTGYSWENRKLDKESTLQTIKLNINNDNSISNKIIQHNKSIILNMNISIKEIRTYLTNLSQAKFAKKFHIPLSTLSHWEQEQRTPPEYVNWMIKEIILNNI